MLVLVLAAAAVVAAGVVALRALEAEREIARLRAELGSLRAELVAPLPIPTRRALQVTIDEPEPDLALEALPPELLRDDWDLLLRGSVDRAARRLGHEPTPGERALLIEALSGVRHAARTRSERGADAGGVQLTRSLVVLEADRRVRDVLGVGVSGLVAALGEAPARD